METDGTNNNTSISFATQSTAGALTERMRINQVGNLGLGGTPSNWQSGRTVLQITPSSTQGHVAFGGVIGNVSTNAFVDATDARWEYISNGIPSLYQQDEGRHIFYTAASGTANSAISWTQAMTLNASGNLGVGTTSPNVGAWGRAITLQGPSNAAYEVTDGTVRTAVYANAGSTGGVSVETNHPLVFATNATERARITSGGDFLVGETATQYSSKILTNGGPISTRIANVDANYGDVFVAGYTANTSERNIIRSAVSSIAGSSGFQFMISDGGGSANVTESFRINRTSCTVVGSLSKGSGSFKIDHPLKPDTHHLVHSFIEGPQADLIYRGKATLVNGKATINIDSAAGMTEGTFVALCREVQCLTSNESDWDAVRGTIAGNILTIECQNANSSATISWVVIGERQDKHMYDTDWTDENGKVIVEPEKVKH
jgi:hypothetical protein